jgi:hypothetical protein
MLFDYFYLLLFIDEVIVFRNSNLSLIGAVSTALQFTPFPALPAPPPPLGRAGGGGVGGPHRAVILFIRSKPQMYRPLSPHILIYKPQLSSIFSVFHRATGVVLSLGVFFLIFLCDILNNITLYPIYIISFYINTYLS